MAGAVPGTLAQVREQFGVWLHEKTERLQELCAPGKDVTVTFTAQAELPRLLFDSGWIRLGWPELCAAGYPPPFSFGTQEVLGPAVTRYAPLARELMPRLLRGDEYGCQDFSESGAGSDLGSLQCRMVADGEDWVINGEKVWTSWAQVADRCARRCATSCSPTPATCGPHSASSAGRS